MYLRAHYRTIRYFYFRSDVTAVQIKNLYFIIIRKNSPVIEDRHPAPEIIGHPALNRQTLHQLPGIDISNYKTPVTY
ncbi:hypothetical protein ES708_34079 [subsurface metagenome]